MKRREVLTTGSIAAGIVTGGLGFGSGRVTGSTPDSSDRTAESTGTDAGNQGYEPLGRVDLEHAFEAVVSADGHTAYVATLDGYEIVDLSTPAEPAILARGRGLLADHDQGPMDLVWDVKVDGEDLLVVGPAHRRAGVVDAAVHVDVSDPTAPRTVGVHLTDFPIHNCDVADGYAYLTGNDGDRNPVVVGALDRFVDESAAIDGDRNPDAEVARWSVLDHESAWADVHQSLRVIHDVWVHDDVAYAAYWDAGTHLLDVSDPAEPSLLGSVDPHEPADLTGLESDDVRAQRLTAPGNHHFAAPSEDGSLLAINEEAWAVDTTTGMVGEPGAVHLYDISDPAEPAHLSTIAAPDTPDPTSNGVWTTSHNFELRGNRLYTSWYEGGVKVHDVSDPTAPEELVWWRDPVNASFWTAQVGVPGEFFVAPSTGYRPTEPALYTFPDEPGEQADPPSMQDALDARRETPSPSPTPTERGVTPTPSTTPDPTADETPGFGIGAGLAALGGATWWLRHRRLDSGE